MTAHPTTCLLDFEDGCRTVITLEEASDSYVEQGAAGVLVVAGDSTGAAGLHIGLSPEALEAIERRCRELRGVPEDEQPPPGTVVAKVSCPCCDARLEVQAGDDDEPEHVAVSQGGSPVVRDLTESVTQAEERAERLEHLVEEWKAASGLECGGDPDGVTPQAAQRYAEQCEQLRRELSAVATVRDSLREQNGRLEQRVAELESELAKRTAPSIGRPYPLE